MEPSAKSANARSGEISLNSWRFSGFTWERNDAVRTNCPIELEKPARKALNGKFVTRTQYTNCMMPESIMKTRKASINLSRFGVLSRYAFHSESRAPETAEALGGVVTLVRAFDGVLLGPAMDLYE